MVFFFFLGVLILFADQMSKHLAREELAPGEIISFLGPLRLTLVFNDGVAFGLGSGGGTVFITLVSLAGLGALLFLIRSAPRGKLSLFAAALIISGALGNLADRIRAGEVTDLFLLPRWPAFNVADIAITSGSLLLALIIIKSIFKEERETDPRESAGGSERNQTPPEEGGGSSGED